MAMLAVVYVLTRVKERDDDVSSSELGPTSKDLSKVEALSLDDSPHASGSTDWYNHYLIFFLSNDE